MSNLSNLDFRRLGSSGQRGSTVLGLALDGSRLEGVVLQRTNGSVRLHKSFATTLSLDPLTAAPELVGREIRNFLDTQGVRERRCVVALPLRWALTVQTRLPELPDSDLANVVQIEAERGFPCDVSTLVIGESRFSAPDEQAYATMVGLPKAHISVLENVLRAAQLKPAGFSLALPCLQPPALEPGGVLAFVIGETHVGLQVSYGGGLVTLRALEGTVDVESGQKRLHADVVARETRITLGQLPAGLREAVKMVKVFGPRELAQRLADEVELRLESLGLQVEVVSSFRQGVFLVQVPADAPVNGAFAIAARHLSGETPAFEFLPPRVSAFQEFASKYSSGTLQRVGLVAGVVVGCVALAFLFQQWQLYHAQSQWASIRTKVTELRELQRNSAQFTPWYDESFRGLSILKRITEAFPEDGSVTAKILEIRDQRMVTCTGTARDYQALLKTVERLRAAPEIPEVSLGQTRGKSPALQFTLSFAWLEGGKSAN